MSSKPCKNPSKVRNPNTNRCVDPTKKTYKQAMKRMQGGGAPPKIMSKPLKAGKFPSVTRFLRTELQPIVSKFAPYITIDYAHMARVWVSTYRAELRKHKGNYREAITSTMMRGGTPLRFMRQIPDRPSSEEMAAVQASPALDTALRAFTLALFEDIGAPKDLVAAQKQMYHKNKNKKKNPDEPMNLEKDLFVIRVTHRDGKSGRTVMHRTKPMFFDDALKDAHAYMRKKSGASLKTMRTYLGMDDAGAEAHFSRPGLQPYVVEQRDEDEGYLYYPPILFTLDMRYANA